MPRLTELYAWVCNETDDPDNEGIPAFNVAGPEGRPMAMPLMGADAARGKSLRDLAQQVADKTGRPVRLLRSTKLEISDTVFPLTKKAHKE